MAADSRRLSAAALDGEKKLQFTDQPAGGDDQERRGQKTFFSVEPPLRPPDVQSVSFPSLPTLPDQIGSRAAAAGRCAALNLALCRRRRCEISGGRKKKKTATAPPFDLLSARG